MLTPLNSIIHLTGYVEQKMLKKYNIEGANSGGIGSSVDKDTIEMR